MALPLSVIFGGILVAGIAAIMNLGAHHIEEGCVGVYWQGGKLLPELTPPGYHGRVPFFTDYHSIPGTSSGIIIYFSRIEVVHKLKESHVYRTVKNYSISFEKTWIYDRVHHEVNQICSKNTLHEVYITKFDQLDEEIRDRLTFIMDNWLDGAIEIVSVRLTKPKIPERIRENYEIIDQYKTKLLIASEKQKRILKLEETTKRSAVLEAEKELALQVINSNRLVEQMKSRYELSILDDDMKLKRSIEATNAWFYRSMKEIDGQKVLLTPEFLNYTRMLVMHRNTEIYYGDHLPKAFSSEDFPSTLMLSNANVSMEA